VGTAVNVVHVTSTFPRTDQDATAFFVADLAGAEQAAGLGVTVVSPHDRGLGIRDCVAGVEVRRFRYGPGRLEVLSYRGGLDASARHPLRLLLVPAYVVAMTVATTLEVKRSGARLIHAHWWVPGGLAALVASRLTGVPFVVTVHGSDIALARRRGWCRLGRLVTRRAAMVLAVSEALAGEARDVLGLPAGSVRVAPMPVPAAARPGGEHVPPPPPPLRLVAAGRLTPEKGFDVLVAAVGELRRAGVSVELDLVGDGPQGDRLDGAGVRRLGALPRDELHRLMADAHAVVVPSRREGLGLVAVEALALGRPVVASRVGGLTATVVDGVDGALVPPDDVPALVAALRRLPLPPPVGSSIETFRPDVVAREHADIYAQAARSRVGRWRPFRWLGAATAVAVVVVLARVAAHDWPAVRQAWRHPDAGALAVAVGAALVAETGFGLASAFALASATEVRVGFRRVASAYWVAQTAKNLPGAVWAALARVGVARQWGVGPRATLGWLATEALASCAAGATVGGVALAVSGAGTVAPEVWIAVTAAAAASPILLWDRSPLTGLVRRLTGSAPRPGQVATAALAYLPVWVAGAVAFAALCRSVVPLEGRDLLYVGGAACVASIAGFLVVPVPSGLGVREAVLVGLLHAVMPPGLAASLALASRILAFVVQTGLAGMGLPVVRRDRDRFEGMDRAGPLTT
jgi:glycosyltransferase involved in cell wall biosynthesis